MTKGAKIALIVASAVLIAGGITTAIVVKKRRDKKKDEAEKEGLSTDKKGNVVDVYSEVGTDETTTKTLSPSDKPPLKIGSRGRYVATLQMALNHLHGLHLKVDGRYGNELRDALSDYEGHWCGGLFGTATNAVLGCPVPTSEYNEIHARAKKKKGWTEYVKNNKDYQNKVTKEYGK